MKLDKNVIAATTSSKLVGPGNVWDKHDDHQEDVHSEPLRFVIVQQRRLWRDCLFRCLGQSHPNALFTACETVDECIKTVSETPKIDAIFFCVGSIGTAKDDIRQLVDKVDPLPVVVLSDTENSTEFVAARECGAKGWMSTNFTVDRAFEAMRTAAAGGYVFSPDGIDSLQRMIPKAPQVAEGPDAALTSRQAAVAEALRQGKPNKIIAYELGMCENTVKVHVRNILKKLHATNRTEAAFKLNEKHTGQAAE